MPEMNDEQHAAQAYERWVVEARENGHNGEPDAFLAGWLAGRDWQTGYDAGVAAVSRQSAE